MTHLLNWPSFTLHPLWPCFIVVTMLFGLTGDGEFMLTREIHPQHVFDVSVHKSKLAGSRFLSASVNASDLCAFKWLLS